VCGASHNGGEFIDRLIARRQRWRLLDLMGKLEWDAGFDYKAERSRR
jgi:hypothetical protein